MGISIFGRCKSCHSKLHKTTDEEIGRVLEEEEEMFLDTEEICLL